MIVQFYKTPFAGMEDDRAGQTIAIGALQNRFRGPVDSYAGRLLFVCDRWGNDSWTRTQAVGNYLRAYLTIGGALAAASNGDVICVLPGTYTIAATSTLDTVYLIGLGGTVDDVKVNGSLKITGDGWGISHLYWTNTGAASFCVEFEPTGASDHQLCNCYLKTTAADSDAIVVDTTTADCDLTVSNCVIQGGRDGIDISGANAGTTTVRNCIIQNCGTRGVDLAGGSAEDEDYNWFYGNTADVNGFVIGANSITGFGPHLVGTTTELDQMSPCFCAGDPDDSYLNHDGSRSHMGARGGTGLLWSLASNDKLMLVLEQPGDGIDPYDDDGSVDLRRMTDGSYDVTFYHSTRRIWPFYWPSQTGPRKDEIQRWFRRLDHNRLTFGLRLRDPSTGTVVRLTGMTFHPQRVGSIDRWDIGVDLAEESP